MRFLDNDLAVASRYPANPNGSPAGITGLTSLDGRATIMMPQSGGAQENCTVRNTRSGAIFLGAPRLG